MILDGLEHYGVEDDEDENLFIQFPEEARVNIGKEAVKALSASDAARIMIKTEEQLRMAYASVGQVFDLPLTDASTMVAGLGLELYKRWILTPDLRPSVLEDKLEKYTKKMVTHFSQLFRRREPRATDEKRRKLSEAHSKLCTRALETILDGARRGHFTSAVFEHCLWVILGVGNAVMREPVSPQDDMANVMTPVLLRVLFELLLLSETRHKGLWLELERSVRTWRHRMATVLQWTATLYGLTDYMFHMLYDVVGTKAAIVRINGTVSELQMAPEFVLFAWYRILDILGDLGEIPDGSTYFAAMQGVERLTRQYLDLTDKLKLLGMDPPHANTTLDIVGRFLIDSLNCPLQPGFERGKAQAIETVFNILQRLPNASMNPVYLGYFYAGIESALGSGVPLLISTVMTNAGGLFLLSQRGAHVLVPSLMHCIYRILASTAPLEGIHCSSTAIRRSCLEMLQTIVAFGFQFADIQFARGVVPLSIGSAPPQGVGELKTFRDVTEFLGLVIMSALDCESDDDNMLMVLQLGTVFAFECVDTNAKWVSQLLCDVVMLSCHLKSRSLTARVARAAFRLVADLALLIPKLLPKREKGEQPAATKLSGPFVVHAICHFVTSSLSTTRPTPDGRVLAEALHTLNVWLEAAGGSGLERKTLSKVFAVINITLFGGEGYHPPRDAVLLAAARELLGSVVYSVGSYPYEHTGLPTVSARIDENDISEALSLVPEDERMFTLRETILTTMELERSPANGTRVAVVTRSMRGRHAWAAALDYMGHDAALGRLPDGLSVHKFNSLEMLPPPRDVSWMGRLGDRLSPEEADVQRAMLECTRARDDAEVGFQRGAPPMPSLSEPPEFPAVRERDGVPSRLLLGSLGTFDVRQRTDLGQFSGRVDRAKVVGALDAQSERDCLTAAVAYVPVGLSSLDELLQVTDCPPWFFDLINELGWPTARASHRGFRGAMDDANCGDMFPYYCDRFVEMAYRVMPLMKSPASESGVASTIKSGMLQTTRVLVLCVEDHVEYSGKNFAPLRERLINGASFVLIVHRLSNGLMRVSVDKNEHDISVSPVNGTFSVSAHSLPTLVRLTTIHAAHQLLKIDAPLPLAPDLRKNILSDSINRNVVELTLSKHYQSLFNLSS